jgi:hypothetical protein
MSTMSGWQYYDPNGLIEPGNIDLAHRPHVKMPGGKYASVRSITVGIGNGHFVLIPTVVGKKVVSNTAAIKYFRKTGQHLGIFANEEFANRYGEMLHRQQAGLPGRG